MEKCLKQLIESYPRLMHGEGPRIPGYIGYGWHPIVMRLMARIDEMLDDDLAQRFRVHQIKEKFGGLRFYFGLSGRRDYTFDLLSAAGATRVEIPDDEVEADLPPRPGAMDAILELVRIAEKEASCTCEVCGEPGERTREGWVQTLCERHQRIKKSGGWLDFEDGT